MHTYTAASTEQKTFKSKTIHDTYLKRAIHPTQKHASHSPLRDYFEDTSHAKELAQTMDVSKACESIPQSKSIGHNWKAFTTPLDMEENSVACVQRDI